MRPATWQRTAVLKMRVSPRLDEEGAGCAHTYSNPPAPRRSRKSPTPNTLHCNDTSTCPSQSKKKKKHPHLTFSHSVNQSIIIPSSRWRTYLRRSWSEERKEGKKEGCVVCVSECVWEGGELDVRVLRVDAQDSGTPSLRLPLSASVWEPSPAACLYGAATGS